ncbi:hypothetical protein [Nonomuraea sp. C10]|uniref:hypothetical protein n=1 Tax=Nonomuraea sp. C10 TaxID=2600577 RepID=UPI0011CE391F|nr:hypothetical protein [Nonomuraea sp. C10]TXK35252.1 hypothetical protein FR742_39085 [Nonomuraea sp. C10]TXK36556.1 hypothetical protein FR742_31285 [Nonomuraea sp. C10]TXK36563.1 hypothetical protein FR742_31320 [Nonomuraea sp. C10]
MRSHKLVLALALTVGLAVSAAPAAATSTAGTCRVELNFVDAYDTDENNGDEIRINLAGYMYPGGGRYVAMNNGDRAYSGNFANPATTIGTTGSALFSLREVTLPVVGQGDVLGSVTAWGFTCATLATGEVQEIPQHIFGSGYWYYMSLVMTGL